jgi:hypothetical protein
MDEGVERGIGGKSPEIDINSRTRRGATIESGRSGITRISNRGEASAAREEVVEQQYRKGVHCCSTAEKYRGGENEIDRSPTADNGVWNHQKSSCSGIKKKCSASVGLGMDLALE